MGWDWGHATAYKRTVRGKEENTVKKYENAAHQFCEAIKSFAAKPDNLDNLENYLSRHFAEWMEKYANTPEDLTCELREFANMIL